MSEILQKCIVFKKILYNLAKLNFHIFNKLICSFLSYKDNSKRRVIGRTRVRLLYKLSQSRTPQLLCCIISTFRISSHLFQHVMIPSSLFPPPSLPISFTYVDFNYDWPKTNNLLSCTKKKLKVQISTQKRIPWKTWNKVYNKNTWLQSFVNTKCN
jgi:hypothetical protein